MTIRRGFALATWAALPICISCSSDSPTEPDPPTLAEQLQDALETTLATQGGRGVSASVLIPGEQPWVGASGMSHGATSITPQMLFGMSSITKSYTAALVLNLADEGLFSLEDSLFQWLPPMEDVDSAATIRQLLNHTSGVYDFIQHPDLRPTLFGEPTRVWTPEEVIATFLAPPYFEAGTGFEYSNTGYLLLGMIIEEATGASVSSELRDRFWGPVGLTRTFLDGEESLVGEVAHPWYPLDGEGIPDDLSLVPSTSTSSATWTAGAVMTTAGDMAEWARALFQGEVLSPSRLDEMLAFNVHGYGLGTDSFGPEYFGAPAIGHTGSGFGYSGVMIYLPDWGTSVAVLINDNNLPFLFATVSALVAEIRGHLSS